MRLHCDLHHAVLVMVGGGLPLGVGYWVGIRLATRAPDL